MMDVCLLCSRQENIYIFSGDNHPIWAQFCNYFQIIYYLSRSPTYSFAVNAFVQLPVAEIGPGEWCLYPTQKRHPTKDDCKLPVCERFCWRADLIASIIPYHLNLTQGTFFSGYNPCVSPWEWPLSPGTQSYQSTAKPVQHFPFSNPWLHNKTASRKGYWTGWAKRELCQSIQHPKVTVRAGCRILPCLDQVVAWRACRLPKFMQENRRWAAPKCY